MIKVGIIGADSPDAGELLRILMNHPEVDVTTLYAPSRSGHKVSACHHGFIGENLPPFSDKIDPSRLDAVFLADDSALGESLAEHADQWPDLKIIDLSPARFSRLAGSDWQYGLSEVNRKGLVRGARMAYLPSAPASIALVALFPLASHLLLSGEISLDVLAPADIVSSIDTDSISKEINDRLQLAQSSFNGNLKVNVISSEAVRAVRIKTVLDCTLSQEEISKIYDTVYDDHNFTFVTGNSVADAEVEGTQKCVVSYMKAGLPQLEIQAVGDGRLRGGAGDAVHVFNLLFALQEKVGLTLKPSSYDSNLSSQTPAQWFA